MFSNILCSVFLCSVVITISYGMTSANDLRDDTYTLQKGRTRRLIWLNRNRELSLPPDTSLSVTPILAFPFFKQSSNWISFENLQIQWTFFILFQGLGWTSEDNAWPLDISFLFPNMTVNRDDTEGSGSIRPRVATCQSYDKNIFNPICDQNIPIMALPMHSPGGERASLIPRVEIFLNSFGMNGRACLQRAVCEVHEIPLKNGFGLFGELLTMLFSISESTYARSHLPGYLMAEKAGKFGDCSNYYRRCPHSLFTSK